MIFCRYPFYQPLDWKNYVIVIHNLVLERLNIRLAAHFIVQMEQGELRMKWTWESQMGETLVLLLSDPNDVFLKTLSGDFLNIVSVFEHMLVF